MRSWVAQATLHRRLGQPQQAVELLRRAARAAPEVEAAYLQPLLAELEGAAPEGATAGTAATAAAAAAAGQSPLDRVLDSGEEEEEQQQRQQQQQQPGEQPEEEEEAVARRQGES